MNHTNGMHSEKSLPVTTCIEDTLKLINHGVDDDDDDDSEEDFILLQMPLVPKEFTVKQEIKTEEEDEVKIEYLYPEQVEIIEEYEDSEVDVPLESNENNEVNLEEEDPQEPSPLKDLQEETRKISYEEQKAELEQKIRDIKTYYSAVSSMCNKLDVFIKSVDEKLVYTEQLNNKHKKVIGKSLDPTNSKSSGWVHVFGAPYFKDRQFFYGPKNYDVLQKEQRNEININSLPNTHLWKPYEKQKVAQAIMDIEVEKRIERCKRRISELSSELHNVDEERRLEMEDELSDVRERRKLIKKLSLAELVHGRFDEYDWLKISVTDLCNHHSPEAVRSMWFAYLHPDINKDEWTAEEMEMLKTLAERNNFQNWSLIAEQLGTGRSEFQCVRFYQMNLNEQLTRSKWTPEEDRTVQQMVERYRVGTFIPWARVAAMVKGRTKVQVFNRWKYCLEPSIRKGRFTEEEDLMILAAMKWYGRNFQQISRFVPGRTPIQLRDRYNASLENTEQFTWDEACDEKLVEMVEEFGQSAWAAVARSFSGFSRVQVQN
ncbi:snRNA-activating protein complex subunit 4 isoform X2 [Bacillus rossius redtenbacheri]|uniref:snRNA-activating protein complex subunit 4 isoform X2 n=1 Tax=Bacillus rossius redtenbacheri TaxID=93214 RepID=UPI002FDD78D3